MRSGVQEHCPAKCPRKPQGQGGVAFLPFLRISLKCLKRKVFEFAPKSLGEHIRRKRLILGLTQLEVGGRLGVSGWTVANWEKDHTKPTAHAKKAVAVFLGHDPETPTT